MNEEQTEFRYIDRALNEEIKVLTNKTVRV